MDSFEPPLVVTAISDPDFEGLVSGALFSRGWSVIARALDFSELQSALVNQSDRKLLVIFSTDLLGSNASNFNQIINLGHAVIGFADESGSDRGYLNIAARPQSPEELLSVVLENGRSTPSRTPLIHAPFRISARVIAVGGVRHSAGTTTFAINLGQEFALLGLKTLVIDANFPAPALATLLDIRHLSEDQSWREIAPHLAAMELNQEKLPNFESLIKDAGEAFQVVIIDLGSVLHLAQELSDRRWSSKIKIWASRSAVDFFLLRNSELLHQRSFEQFMQSLATLSLKSNLHLVKVQSAFKESPQLRKRERENQNWGSTWELPWDQRSCQSAVAERTTLQQVAERGALRKEIAVIAQALCKKSPK